MSEEQPAKVTLGHLVRAERICALRLKLDHANTKANFSSNGRWRVSNRVTEEVRLADTELATPSADRFAGTADDLTPEQRSVYELATRWYVTLFTRPVRVVDEDRWGTDLPGDLRLVGQGGLAFTDADGKPEIRLLSFASRFGATASAESPGVRFALLRRTDQLRGATVRVAAADLVHGTYEEETIDTAAVMPEIDAWLQQRIAVIQARRAREARTGAWTAVRVVPAHRPLPTHAGSGVKERLLPDIVPISASSLDMWRRCPREYLNKYVLGLPESDSGGSPDFGNLVHAMLEQVHRGGSCRDTAHVDEVLALHGIDAEGAISGIVARHAERCPSPAEDSDHELELARFHRLPPPMFMATGRLDAVWLHDGLLEIRDYKTGSVVTERIADDPRARLQAWLAAPLAARLGLQIRVRYEHLAAEIADDPEPFEPDADDLDAIDEELRSTAAAIQAAATANEFPGVGEAEVCGFCRYRSICPDSAARGVPTWPTPPDVDLEDE